MVIHIIWRVTNGLLAETPKYRESKPEGRRKRKLLKALSKLLVVDFLAGLALFLLVLTSVAKEKTGIRSTSLTIFAQNVCTLGTSKKKPGRRDGKYSPCLHIVSLNPTPDLWLHSLSPNILRLLYHSVEKQGVSLFSQFHGAM